MNQFKAIFLGENRDGLSRAANSQKCMRVSGKHNDLEEVGRDHYHHTFFEMLGNWSFGDYYKKEAIRWAWELLTEVWHLPKDRLFVTVHHSDDDAARLWVAETDISAARVMKFGDKENFWEMGETGPCGPCSEIHFDTGDLADQQQIYNDPIKGVNGKNARFLEIWNLVFMQYNRQPDRSLPELPKKHVDTGMGLERVVRIIQGVNSNYDTDLFRPLIAEVERQSGKAYSTGEDGTPFRVIADHVRALTFAITDGALPSNEGRGYVLRRLLRRACRFGRELGFHEPFLHKLVPAISNLMGEAFPEIAQRRDHVVQVIANEEERFAQTLEQGIEKFGQMVDRCISDGSKSLAGNDVFMLYDTYGFPVDLTRLMAEEKGLNIDEAGFNGFMDQQRGRARDAQKRTDDEGLSADGWVELKKIQGTEFCGYFDDEAEVSVARYKTLKPENAADSCTECLVILDRTPFYAESGGQTGDSGILVTTEGRKLEVSETFKWNDMTVHKVSAAASFPVVELKGLLAAKINSSDRNHTRRNHSATHLLQAALRVVLGSHVQQSGSRVDRQGLRFDFTHFKALTPDELTAVETQVNEWVLADLPVTTDIQDTDTAKKAGAMALFGEKYGDTVRVVSMGRVSKELCGGTHVLSTGRIGLFHITAESSIASGVRRIEAITGTNSMTFLANKELVVTRLTSALKSGEDVLVERVTALMERVKTLEIELERLSRSQALSQVNEILTEAAKSGCRLAWTVKNLGVIEKKSFTAVTNAVSDMIKDKKIADIVIVLGAEAEGAVMLAACAGNGALKASGIHCGEIVKAAAAIAGGSGGGSPVRAQAGAKETAKINEALETARKLIIQKAGA
jgi:alanyl-tRNA synthetase